MRVIKLTSLLLGLLTVLAGVVVAVQHDQESLDVSLIQLVANADKYDGKKVKVIGFLRLEFEGNALYLHREDFEKSLTKNAIWIDATSDMTSQRKKFDQEYVLLEGTFDSKRQGHMGLFSGELHHIKRAEVWRFGREGKGAKE